MALLLLPAGLAQQKPGAADLILLNAKVWTAEPASPQAEAVAIRGNRIVKVGSSADVRALAGEKTRILDLKGKLVLPGFIDNHTHFASAGRLLLGLNLLEVNESDAFVREVGAAAKRLPAGAWLLGGDWGAYAAWAKSSAGKETDKRQKEFEPDKALIDSVTGDHPALISRFDQQVFLANSLALKAAGITRDKRDPEGGSIVRDANGEPTGLLRGTAAQLVRKVIPRPSHAQRRAEALRALAEARKWGVTTVHDNVADFDQLALFEELRQSGELTSRVWARMWLSEWEAVRDHIAKNKIPSRQGGWGDDYIQLGGLKAWVDGIMGNSSALFFEPYRHQPQSSGRLRDVMFPEGNLLRLIEGADRAGFTVTVHAIGDKANRILLDTYEQVFAKNPARDRRFRVVHAQVVHPDDFARFGKLKLVAEVQPYHCIDDMRWMEERIGDRARNAYAFRRLKEAGAKMSFGSDWPGTNASYYPINPLLGIYAAVTRQTLKGEPPAGWFPAERVSMEDAVRAFTIGNAYATFEEGLKGSIKEGKLADLVVLDRDIFSRPPAELKDTRVLYTIFDGKVIYESSDVDSRRESANDSIRPGLGVGPLLLGTTRQRTAELFPVKRGTDQEWSDACGTTLHWVDKLGYVSLGTLTIRFKDEKVVQIESASTRFKTLEGVTFYDSPEKVRQHYPHLRAYSLDVGKISAFGDRPLIFWVDRSEGIAFVFAYGRTVPKPYLYKIIVFEPNTDPCPEDDTWYSAKWQELPPYSLGEQ